MIYDNQDQFPIGGCKVLCQSGEDQDTVLAAGVTVHEALAAHERLLADGIRIRVIDRYSGNPGAQPQIPPDSASVVGA